MWYDGVVSMMDCQLLIFVLVQRFFRLCSICSSRFVRLLTLFFVWLVAVLDRIAFCSGDSIRRWFDETDAVSGMFLLFFASSIKFFWSADMVRIPSSPQLGSSNGIEESERPFWCNMQFFKPSSAFCFGSWLIDWDLLFYFIFDCFAHELFSFAGSRGEETISKKLSEHNALHECLMWHYIRIIIANLVLIAEFLFLRDLLFLRTWPLSPRACGKRVLNERMNEWINQKPPLVRGNRICFRVTDNWKREKVYSCPPPEQKNLKGHCAAVDEVTNNIANDREIFFRWFWSRVVEINGAYLFCFFRVLLTLRFFGSKQTENGTLIVVLARQRSLHAPVRKP